MLWPDGRASVNMKNYTELHNAGYRAVKEVFPESKVILHIDRGDSGAHYNWLLDGMAVHAAQYDVIGMSLYPDPGNWQYINEACLINMKALIGKYNKDIMICEVGMNWDQPEICKGFLIDLIDKALERVTDAVWAFCTGSLRDLSIGVIIPKPHLTTQQTDCGT